ncbi:hypothetical protein BmHG_00065 [Borrelia miyamotoi]|nr:hypothetical protein BmHH_00063 [Borrelia miyamotoi]BCR09301.1 hypothetical protein BmHG_00065 [Borrelia miyamotoi]BCR10131.1 hypothetical protein BmHF_00064 [Borrelia miyamotoi]BCR10960.1 hypothetical protein BmHI_00064 [Borrelia miyamotoi]BCR11788.1 hypothetical protein BmHA_00063 [Borrelia miyamotoi]
MLTNVEHDGIKLKYILLKEVIDDFNKYYWLFIFDVMIVDATIVAVSVLKIFDEML